MEKTGFETPAPCMIEESTLAFPPHRRSHLKSRTFKTFVQILSLYVDHSQINPDLRAISENPRTDDHCAEPELTTQKASQDMNLLVDNGMKTNKSTEQLGMQQRAFNSSEIVKEKEHRLGTEGKGEHQISLTEEHLTILNELERCILQDFGQGAHELMNNRLFTSVESVDNIKDRTYLERGFGDMKDHERQQTLVDSSLMLLDDKETEEGEILGGVFTGQPDDLFLERSVVLEERKVDGDMIEPERQIERDTLANSFLNLLVDEETEEGEILDGGSCQSGEMFLKDSMVPEERKADEEQIPGDHARQKVFEKMCKEQRGTDGNDMVSMSHHVGTSNSVANCSSEQVKLKKSDEKVEKYYEVDTRKILNVERSSIDDHALEAGADGKEVKKFNGSSNFPLADPNSLGHSGEVSLKALTEKQENKSMEKKVKVGDKRKRSMTKESKARKKLRERKKRAEKNRQLGVKRLKLQPISKPKPLRYCNFYLNGRCQQGYSCKFSHDTTPLTKSQPCKFLALNSCLKGDDCPFDHQLSKYPCNNFKSKGSCNRGDKCLFSHKIMQVESSAQASNGSHKEPEAPSMLPCTDSGRQLNNNSFGQTLKIMKETSARTTVQRYPGKNVAEVVLRPQAQTAKGISLSGRQLNNSPSVWAFNRVKETTSRTLSSVENPVHRHPDKNMAESVLKPPAQTPKGLSFLSFGKTLFDDVNKQLQGTLLSKRDKGSEACSGKNQSESEKIHNPNEMPCKTPASPFFLCNSSKQIALERFQNSSGTPWKTPESPQFSSCESTKAIAETQNKNTQSSAQKALLSTMAFATKYQSQMIDRSIKSPPSNVVSKGSSSSNTLGRGSIQKGSMTASKILQEFLFGGGDSKA